MSGKKNCIFFWSGGKDSCLALHEVLDDPEIEVKNLVTTLSDEHGRISMHGVRESLLILQAEAIDIPLYQIRLGEMPDMESYHHAIQHHFHYFKAQGISHVIYGDIFLEDLRLYREKEVAAAGLEAIFPLWKRDSNRLINQFLSLGYQTVIVCAQQNLQKICGQVITAELISHLLPEVDPCGENGEFHTFVFDGPMFKNPIPYRLGEVVLKHYPAPKSDKKTNHPNTSVPDSIGFWFADLKI